LLLIDDQPAQGSLISALAARANWRVSRAPDVRSAISSAGGRRDRIDAVLMDVWSPEADAAGAIAAVHSEWPGMPVVVMTAQDSGRLAINAIRAGASDFLLKPIAPDRLLAALDHAAVRRNEGELRPLAEKPSAVTGFADMIGTAPLFRQAIERAMRVAPTSAPVLIEGERGVGKESVARAIHAAGPRASQPFVTLDCRAVPANLFESELFGHERGAFTGAFERRLGKLAIADGGTLFLDEIDEMPIEIQTKLLHAIETGQINPVGARVPRSISTRLIAAANGELSAAVARGRFIGELAEQLSVAQILLPPLRERDGDVAALAGALLPRIAAELERPTLDIDAEASALLDGFGWPGNVRQLHNTLFRAAIFCDGATLTAADFPHLARSAAGEIAIAPPEEPKRSNRPGLDCFKQDGHIRPLEAMEADLIRLAVQHYQGRMTEVARRLGIGRSTLYRKLAELGIEQTH
jgi:DNA-binding NtrC family response regulator